MILNPTSLSRKVAFRVKKEDFDLLCRFVAILHINMRAFFSMNRFSVKEAKVTNCGDCDLVAISPEVQEACLSMFRE